MCKGWIKVDRGLSEHWLAEDKPYNHMSAWIDLLMLANHTDKKTVYKGELVTCKRGDVNLSILALSERWGWNRKKTTAFLKLLESDGMVTTNITKHRTTVTIENYDKFQGSGTTNGATNGTTDEQQTGQGRVNGGTTKGQPRDITKNDKNDKNDKNERNNIPYGDIVETFNSLCPSLPRCAKLTDGRRKHIKARYKSYSLNDIETVFTKAEASDFLSGRSKTNWNATFDWLMKSDENFQKVLEGTYDNKTQYKAPRQTGGIDWDAI